MQAEAQKAVEQPFSREIDSAHRVPTEQTHHAAEEGFQSAEDEDAISEVLPTSTHASMQAGTTINNKPASESTEAGIDSADGGTSPTSCQPVLAFPLPMYDAIGELSFMSDGSFIKVKDTLAIGDEVDAAQGASDEIAMQIVSAQCVSEPASPLSHSYQQTDQILDVARRLSEDLAEGQGKVFEKAAVVDNAAVEKTAQVCTSVRWSHVIKHTQLLHCVFSPEQADAFADLPSIRPTQQTSLVSNDTECSAQWHLLLSGLLSCCILSALRAPCSLENRIHCCM